MAKIDSSIVSCQKLYIFNQVALRGSITAAAEALCLTQPAVTNTVRQLESHFGMALVRRVGKKLALTPAGQQVVAHWEHFKRAYINLEYDMSRLKSGVAGKIALTMVSSAKYFVPQLMVKFLDQFPQAEFSCITRHRNFITRDILVGNVDIGLMTDPPGHTKVCSVKLGANPLVFIAHPAHPIAHALSLTPDDLARHAFITRESEALITQVLHRFFAQHCITPTLRLCLDSTEAIKQSVLSNLGVALVPKISVMRELEHGDVIKVDVKAKLLENYWYVVFRIEDKSNLLLQNFIKCLQKNFNSIVSIS